MNISAARRLRKFARLETFHVSRLACTFKRHTNGISAMISAVRIRITRDRIGADGRDGGRGRGGRDATPIAATTSLSS